MTMKTKVWQHQVIIQIQPLQKSRVGEEGEEALAWEAWEHHSKKNCQLRHISKEKAHWCWAKEQFLLQKSFQTTERRSQITLVFMVIFLTLIMLFNFEIRFAFLSSYFCLKNSRYQSPLTCNTIDPGEPRTGDSPFWKGWETWISMKWVNWSHQMPLCEKPCWHRLPAWF